MLLQAKPIEIALSRRSNANQFSSMRCVGTDEDIVITSSEFTLARRTCVLSNVCYQADVDDWFFYRPRDLTTPPVVYDHLAGMQWKFRYRKANGDKENSNFFNTAVAGEKDNWAPDVKLGPMPGASDRMYFPGLWSISSMPHNNFAHFIWESAHPLLVAMAQLGIYTEQLNILYKARCMTRSSAKKMGNCSRLIDAFVAPLTGSPPAGADTPRGVLSEIDTWIRSQKVKLRKTGKSALCFENVMVGGPWTSFLVRNVFLDVEMLNEGKEPLIQLFRSRVLRWHGIDPAFQPRSHHIRLIDKAAASSMNRRGIYDFPGVLHRVTERFGQVATVRSTSWVGMPIAEQLRMISTVTIAITVGGAVFGTLPFLPVGAYAILIGYAFNRTQIINTWEGKKNLTFADGHIRGVSGQRPDASWTMEAELWRHVRHVNLMHYQVFGPTDYYQGDMSSSTIVVDNKRLGALIQAALNAMEPGYHYDQPKLSQEHASAQPHRAQEHASELSKTRLYKMRTPASDSQPASKAKGQVVERSLVASQPAQAQPGKATQQVSTGRLPLTLLSLLAVVLVVGVGGWMLFGQSGTAVSTQANTLALAVVYCISGSLLSWANKVISIGESRLDLSVILILQNTVTFALIWMLALAAPATVRSLRVESWGVIFKQFVPATGLFCLMLVTSLKAFQSASIAAVVVQRNLISLVTAAAEYVFLKRGMNKLALASLVGILAGAIVFGAGDVEFDQLGYGWLLMNITASSAFQILNKKLVHGVELSSFGFSFFNNLISVAMLLVWALPSGALVEASSVVGTSRMNNVALVLSCFLGFALSVSAFALSKEVSATTMMVVNNSNKFLLVMGIELLNIGKPIGLQGWAGCVLAISFAMLYTHAKMQK